MDRCGDGGKGMGGWSNPAAEKSFWSVCVLMFGGGFLPDRLLHSSYDVHMIRERAVLLCVARSIRRQQQQQLLAASFDSVSIDWLEAADPLVPTHNIDRQDSRQCEIGISSSSNYRHGGGHGTDSSCHPRRWRRRWQQSGGTGGR